MRIPEGLAAFAANQGAAGTAWLDRLPDLIDRFARRWCVDELATLDGCGEVAWVGGGRREGVEVVLKLSWPHAEAATEAAGLRFFDGRGAAELLEADEPEFALLIERCRPGADIWSIGPEQAHRVAASVLERLWREPGGSVAPIGTLADTVAEWNAQFPSTRQSYPAALVGEATELGVVLSESTRKPVVVHGDFNPFNVLSSRRDGWLAIDPKPLLGDRAYDLAQYLGNWIEAADESGDAVRWMASAVDFFADRLALDPYRIAAWAFVKSLGWNWGVHTAQVFKTLADQTRGRSVSR